MLRRTADLRDRIDGLRRRFETSRGRESLSPTDALNRLTLAIDRHFDQQATTQATADRLLGALDVVPQGIVLADPAGQVVFRNRSAARYFDGRHGDALVGAAIAELLAEATAGKTVTRTVELFGPPRQALQLRAVALEDEETTGPAGVFLVVEDVSERHHLDAVRRDFVANISHELKTPVGALGLLAETLAEEPDPEVAQRLARRMQHEAFRVAATIDDLLQLSQIEGSDLADAAPVEVSAVVDEAVARTRPAAELAEVRLQVEPVEPGLVVVGDRLQLVSAVANLLDNAVKYSDAGGEVQVTVASDDQSVQIAFTDRGVGIPVRDLERVFERFYRVDRARSRETGGTGLGLAIVRHVAQNHHGDVTVASREGEGSTFTLTLPLKEPRP